MIPNAIRGRVDVSQIVNDSLYEWIHTLEIYEYEEPNAALSEELLMAIMHDILQKRTIDSIQKEMTLVLDDFQQSVLKLRFEGNTESEIAEKLRIPMDAVRAARKAIAAIAEEVLGRNQEPRKNSFGKWRFSECRTRFLLLIH